jgi:hypothetical protein
MHSAEEAELDLETVSKMVRQSEIDFRTLKANVRKVLDQQQQASVSEVLALFPAEQGLGSVVGYVALGAKHGEVTQSIERVCWQGNDGVDRSARVPTVYFIREKYHELMQ